MPHYKGASCRYRLTIHLETAGGVRIEELPQGLSCGCPQCSHFLMPREFCCGEGGDKLAVHVSRRLDLRKGFQPATQVLAVVDDIVVEAIAGICSLKLKDVPDTWSAALARSQHEGVVRLRNWIECVSAENPFGLVPM